MANSRTLSLDEIQNCSAKPPLRAESPCSTRFRTCSMRLLQLRVPEFPADARLVLKILHSLPAASVVTRTNSRQVDFTSNLRGIIVRRSSRTSHLSCDRQAIARIAMNPGPDLLLTHCCVTVYCGRSEHRRAAHIRRQSASRTAQTMTSLMTSLDLSVGKFRHVLSYQRSLQTLSVLCSPPRRCHRKSTTKQITFLKVGCVHAN